MPEPGPDRARRRLEARDEQQVADVQHLVIVERTTVVIGGQQRGDDIGTWFAASQGDEVSEVVVDIVGCRSGDRFVLGSGEDDVFNPLVEPGCILHREPAVLAEDHGGQQSAVPGDVDHLRVGQVVE